MSIAKSVQYVSYYVILQVIVKAVKMYFLRPYHTIETSCMAGGSLKTGGGLNQNIFFGDGKKNAFGRFI